MAQNKLLVEAKGIIVKFAGRPILDNVDLRIAEEEIVMLIGLNGAGKSTLVKVILGLIKPYAGVVVLRPGLCIGYAPQQLQREAVFPMTVRRFLDLGGEVDSRRRMDILKEVGAEGILEHQMANISGGELNRIMLARALLRDPELLVLDEPLAGVDVTGRSDLYRLIADIRGRHRCGVLLVSHDLHLVMGAADQVLCLNNHVCCTGHPETVASHPEFINLFGSRLAETMGVYVHRHDHRHGIDGHVHQESRHGFEPSKNSQVSD